MIYTEGAHDSPADTKDRLIRVGTKYHATAPAVADGDNVYLLVDSAGRIIVGGSAAHDAVDAGSPIKTGAVASGNISNVSDVANGDRVDHSATLKGAQYVVTFLNLSGVSDGLSSNVLSVLDESDSEQTARFLAFNVGQAPDMSWDMLRTAGDAAPGLGALNVAPIGGDITLRASAVAGETNGTSTAVDYLGWVKNLHAVLDVTAVPTGGTPTLDVYLQAQLADGTWQDIAHFSQVAGSTAKQILAWKGSFATEAGTQAEGAAVTVDNYFSNEDAALAATTVRLLPLGDSMRVKWVFAAGGSIGDYTFSVDMAANS